MELEVRFCFDSCLRSCQTDPQVTLICWGRCENRNEDVVDDLKVSRGVKNPCTSMWT